MPESIIHLHVPATTKGRWIRLSRSAGLRLTDYIINAVEAYMHQQLVNISIPDDLEFSELRLARDADGDVSFEWPVIETICKHNKLPIELFSEEPEDNVCQLIVFWYQSHKQHGGIDDPVAEDLLRELAAEEAAGQPFSLQPGRA
jgi:hypothetical protein